MERNDVSQELQAFAAVARKYCTWAEGPPGDPHEEMQTARKLLSELQIAVLLLPDECPANQSPDDVLGRDDWRNICERFQILPVQGYWEVFDPLDEDSLVFSLLPDDLADIWRDVKEALVIFDTGDFSEACWQWRFNYDIHWGRHLTSAQRAIYSYFS